MSLSGQINYPNELIYLPAGDSPLTIDPAFAKASAGKAFTIHQKSDVL
jgi:hypothetical protein